MTYEGMIAERISIGGDKNEPISAYVARPLGPGADQEYEIESPLALAVTLGVPGAPYGATAFDDADGSLV